MVDIRLYCDVAFKMFSLCFDLEPFKSLVRSLENFTCQGRNKTSDIVVAIILTKMNLCVIGGGPVGLEMAVSAVKRGLTVTLLEKVRSKKSC